MQARLLDACQHAMVQSPSLSCQALARGEAGCVQVVAPARRRRRRVAGNSISGLAAAADGWRPRRHRTSSSGDDTAPSSAGEEGVSGSPGGSGPDEEQAERAAGRRARTMRDAAWVLGRLDAEGRWLRDGMCERRPRLLGPRAALVDALGRMPLPDACQMTGSLLAARASAPYLVAPQPPVQVVPLALHP